LANRKIGPLNAGRSNAPASNTVRCLIAQATGWGWFFVVCALAGLPSLLLLAFLQRRGHFVRLVAKTS